MDILKTIQVFYFSLPQDRESDMGGVGQMKPYKMYVPSMVTAHLGLGLFSA